MNRILIPVLCLALCGAAIAQTVPGQLQARLANVEAKAAAAKTVADAAAPAAHGVAGTNAQARVAVLETSKQTTNAVLDSLVAHKSVVSYGSTGLICDFGTTTNGGTVTWSGGPYPTAVYAVASYLGSGKTNAGGYLAAAHIVQGNATNCTVAGDAVDTAAYILVLGIGQQ